MGFWFRLVSNSFKLAEVPRTYDSHHSAKTCRMVKACWSLSLFWAEQTTEPLCWVHFMQQIFKTWCRLAWKASSPCVRSPVLPHQTRLVTVWWTLWHPVGMFWGIFLHTRGKPASEDPKKRVKKAKDLQELCASTILSKWLWSNHVKTPMWFSNVSKK